MRGILEPTLEEQMAKNGHGTIHIKVFILKGDVGKENEFQVAHTFKNLIVTYQKREVLFSIEEMVKEAVALIEKALK